MQLPRAATHGIARSSSAAVAVACLVVYKAVFAQDAPDANATPDKDPGTAPVSREEHERVLDELGELRRDFDALRATGALAGDAAGGTEAEAAAPPRLSGYKGGLYDKPFLEELRERVSIGGYFDVEYRDPEGARHDFRFHRLIPFIYADVHERVRFATEIEIEDGSELAVEFAYLDLLFIDEVNFRGGVILDPLGKFNSIHDSPINDLTDRPLVDEFVIPTTLREVGAGFFGSLTQPEDPWEVKYEAYLASGFKGLDNGGMATITSTSGLRRARPHGDALGTREFSDINNQFAAVGRLSVSPFIGSEFGASAHSGAYDERGDNLLTTTAVDGLVTVPQFEIGQFPVGPIEILGEGAYAFVERDRFARASGVADDLWGYYAQVNYHFMPPWLVANLPLLFSQQSTFTLVGRWGHVDLDGNRRRRVTVGLNFRPVESTVIKLDYQFNQGTGSAPESADDDAFLVSIASYF